MKTVPTDKSVEGFLHNVENKKRRQDAFSVLEMMKEITGEPPKMWGQSIVGFGQYHYKYDSGREGDFLKIGFSPRKTSLVLYLMTGFERYEELMSHLGKHKTGKSCLYVNKLEQVDEAVLRELIAESMRYMNEKYG